MKMNQLLADNLLNVEQRVSIISNGAIELDPEFTQDYLAGQFIYQYAVKVVGGADDESMQVALDFLNEDAYFNNNKVIAYNAERAIQIAQCFRESMTA